MVEYYYGLERQGLSGKGPLLAKSILCIIAITMGPFLRDCMTHSRPLDILDNTATVGWTAAFATGWTDYPSLLFGLLGLKFGYRQEQTATSWRDFLTPSMSMIVYGLRLVQSLANQEGNEGVPGPVSASASAFPGPPNKRRTPMPVAQPKPGFKEHMKKTVCPVCSTPFFDKNRELVSLPSGYVFCKSCLPDPDKEGKVECPVSGIRILARHVRLLHL